MNTDRDFTLTTDSGTALCLLTGTGNINGNNDDINDLGYLTLDKTDDNALFANLFDGELTVTGSTSGTFLLDTTKLAGFTSFVIGFKTGGGQSTPDWAAFMLPTGVFSGSWSVDKPQGLSHANLYGVVGQTGGPGVIPLPAAAWLLLSGMGGLALAARRRAA